MPCEGCRVQFTVFRRKKVCADCKRFYCYTCLTSDTGSARSSHDGGLLRCERCAILAKRPLLRTDLLQLKPKDLIFYLQSKHISTAGCVEKDELIHLVLNHAQQQQQQQQQQPEEATSPGSGGRRDRRRSSSSGGHKHNRPHGDTTNSFLNLKQSCQSFFTNITDNLSDSFATFENRSTTKQRSQTSGAGSPSARPDNSPTHISDQPRVSTREIPTYASFQRAPSGNRHNNNTSTTAPPILTVRLEERDTRNIPERSQATSPVMSTVNTMMTPRQEIPNTTTTTSCDVDSHRECECSDADDDDDIIATYTSSKGGEKSPLNSEEIKTPSSSIAQKEPTRLVPKEILAAEEDSSQSSFEELGAIGGISDDSKTTTDTSSNLDQWHILDTQREEYSGQLQLQEIEEQNQQNPTQIENVENESLPGLSSEARHSLSQFQASAERQKKITRRRSDSYLRKKLASSDDDDSPTTSEHVLRRLAINAVAGGVPTSVTSTVSEPEEPKTPQRNCKRCGKTKLNIRRQVEKMRLHLESSQMHETDIKNELREFLAYLERRTKSVDYSEDSETAASSAMGNHYTPDSQALAAAASIAAAFAAVVDEMDDDDGINVYATPAGYNGNRRDSRFLQLEDFETMEDLEGLSVKQLKEVLMLNRVDYKGCCEKQELLERVERLWKNLKSTPAIEKLQTDELCKICMDAPIECVILECGHMATCTNCGKVLSECPICRQYIVRVVRFFRA